MKLITRIAFSCLFLLPLASCVQNNQPANQPAATTTGTPSAGGAAKRFAFVTNNASDFWTIARRGTEKADTEFADVTVEFKIPADGTAAEQKRLVDDLLAKGVDGIAISPVDPNNQTQMINDVAKQAIVFTQDSDAPQSDRIAYVGT
ncbi:MAG: substrate-binding domain-containing protein, partial [Pyrinomonadaceae bacterium]